MSLPRRNMLVAFLCSWEKMLMFASLKNSMTYVVLKMPPLWFTAFQRHQLVCFSKTFQPHSNLRAFARALPSAWKAASPAPCKLSPAHLSSFILHVTSRKSIPGVPELITFYYISYILLAGLYKLSELSQLFCSSQL